ncbi:hypothetical protein GUJ93_ZPchr0009g2318 [Zizania palustris]|uniref:Uncharacterized protein n=1 Tax=Zizania palustris TaxID=103762 RepID=A0A8J5RK83_ZIZPA|nr:hypothetical protein GUJ93_ZPchr0009g2318 [Zizania palustris]
MRGSGNPYLPLPKRKGVELGGMSKCSKPTKVGVGGAPTIDKRQLILDTKEPKEEAMISGVALAFPCAILGKVPKRSTSRPFYLPSRGKDVAMAPGVMVDPLVDGSTTAEATIEATMVAVVKGGVVEIIDLSWFRGSAPCPNCGGRPRAKGSLVLS